MKKQFLLIAFLIFGYTFSQVTLSGNTLLKDGQTYKLKQYKEVLSNPTAQDLFKKARANSTAASIFAYSGGFLIGFGIIPAIKGGGTETVNGVTYKRNPKAAWTVVGIGAGLVAIGIPFAITSSKSAKEALDIENDNKNAFKPHFRLETAGNGLALSYNF